MAKALFYKEKIFAIYALLLSSFITLLMIEAFWWLNNPWSLSCWQTISQKHCCCCSKFNFTSHDQATRRCKMMKSLNIPSSKQEQGKQTKALLTLLYLLFLWLLKFLAWCEVCLQCCSWRQALELSRVSSLVIHTFAILSKAATTYSACTILEYTEVTFNTNSFKVGVNTCASATMSGNKDLFEDLVLKVWENARE